MSKELSRLKAINLREVWPDEAQDFTPWLAEEENLDILSETLGMELEMEAQEKGVGAFRADLLCRDTLNNSRRVLIENQLERTDHSHLGQILTYAAGLEAHTVIWIAEEFREEHRAALDRLNEVTTENFQCFGIEVKVWQIGNSDHAPQFDIVSKPNDWNRTVSRETERLVRADLSETYLQLERFWTALRTYMYEKDSPIRCPKPNPSHYLPFGIGRAGFSMEGRVAFRRKDIAVHLVIAGQDAKAHFKLLKQQQVEIQTELSETLEWEELPDKASSRISLRKENTDPQDESDWTTQHDWLSSKLELFDRVFRPRIKTLNAADWDPSEEGLTVLSSTSDT